MGGGEGVADARHPEVRQSGHNGLGHLPSRGDTDDDRLSRVAAPAGTGTEQDVGGFDVPVDHAGAMNRGQSLSDTCPQGRHLRRWQTAVRPQKISQVAAVDVVHDDREGGALDDDVTNGDDIGAAHPQQSGALLDEALHDVGVLHQLRTQNLEGQGLPGVRAPTAPDLSLGTRTDPGLHDVGASEVTGGGALGHECSVLLKGGQTS